MSKPPYDDKDDVVVNEPLTSDKGSDNKDNQSLSAPDQPNTETKSETQHSKPGEVDTSSTADAEDKRSSPAPVQPENEEKSESRDSEQSVSQAETEERKTISSSLGDETAPPRKNWNAMNYKIRAKKEPTTPTPKRNENGQPINNLFNGLSRSFTDQQDGITAHRKTLLKWFAWITAIQLSTINVLIFICVCNNVVLGDIQILNAVLDFIKYFIGATFLELMGGLLIIVKFVFSREAYDMLKHLTRVEPSEEDQTQ